ncbi:hypothetical protein DAMA08_035580 [Martiniozyma asiatica (nom. inval.)]|nr:hypothetical protein DAMA08_035580 [Martiniozyma asiatica]
MTTTVNPRSTILHYPGTDHQSLVLLTTPSQLNNVITTTFNEFNASNKSIKQILVACVDTILSSRNAYSELYLDTPFELQYHQTTEQSAAKNNLERDPLSVDPVKFDKNWKDQKDLTSLQLTINDTIGKVQLANTLFANGEYNTCFYVGGEKFDWHNLSNANVKINFKNGSKGKLQYSNRLSEIPLVEDAQDNRVYQVTDFEGNLVKSINDEPASGYLINNSKVMGSKKDLFFKLYESEEKSKPWKDEYYRLLVGGLGWGEKQAIIAIDPIVGNIGYRKVKLYYYNSETPEYKPKIMNSQEHMIVWECSELENGYDSYQADTEENTETIYSNIFGIGCEAGYELDGITHRSHAETIELKY